MANSIIADLNNSKKSANNYCISNILGKQKKDDEFYTPAYIIEELLTIINIPKNKVIWCPFDLASSNFVKVLKSHKYKVISSHIEKNKDFYKYQPKEKWDIILSNPPFSYKRLLIERCESLTKNNNKDFCLLYGATICSQSMGNTLNRCAFHFIQKNVKFKGKNKDRAFQCLWLFNKGFKYF